MDVRVPVERPLPRRTVLHLDMRLSQEERGLRLGEGSTRLGEGRLRLGELVIMLKPMFMACLGSASWLGL